MQPAAQMLMTMLVAMPLTASLWDLLLAVALFWLLLMAPNSLANLANMEVLAPMPTIQEAAAPASVFHQLHRCWAALVADPLVMEAAQAALAALVEAARLADRPKLGEPAAGIRQQQRRQSGRLSPSPR